MAHSLSERFWSKVQKTDSCWLWKAGTVRHYGLFSISQNRKPMMYRAHRIAWELTNGQIPEDKQVLHRCDNPSCVRPDHLFLGTIHDNILDAMKKHRWRPIAPYLANIRDEYAKGLKTLSEIGQEYNVSETTIGRIITGNTWNGIQ